jgi:hypothetical protein
MAEPTTKALNVEKFLSDLAGESRSTAIVEDRCLFCKGPATQFTDAVSKREFEISGMCQTCQDDFFNEDDD